MNCQVLGGRFWVFMLVFQLLIMVYNCLILLLRKFCFFGVRCGVGRLKRCFQFGLLENSLVFYQMVLVLMVLCLVVDMCGVILWNRFSVGCVISDCWMDLIVISSVGVKKRMVSSISIGNLILVRCVFSQIRIVLVISQIQVWVCIIMRVSVLVMRRMSQMIMLFFVLLLL